MMGEATKRVLRGGLWGLAATSAMTFVMGIDILLSGSPGPRTYPILIVGRLLGHGSRALLGVTTVTAQLIYGSFMGIVFAFLASPMTYAKGFAIGILLWFILQIEFIPWLGWGDFGFERGGAALLYTLFLHLIYGAVLGWFGSRDDTAHAAHFDDLGRLVV